MRGRSPTPRTPSPWPKVPPPPFAQEVVQPSGEVATGVVDEFVVQSSIYGLKMALAEVRGEVERLTASGAQRDKDIEAIRGEVEVVRGKVERIDMGGEQRDGGGGARGRHPRAGREGGGRRHRR